MGNNYISISNVLDYAPGFSFSYPGYCASETYLQIDSIPSNLASRVVPFNTAKLSKVFITCQENSTFDVDIQIRSNNNFITIYTISVSDSRIFNDSIQNVELNFGDEICVKLSNGSVTNIIVGLIIKGN